MRIDSALKSLISLSILVPSATAIIAWSLAMRLCLRQLLLHRLVRRRQEDDFAVSRLGHSLHRLKVSNLHGWRRAQDISSLAHQFGRLDLSARSNDLSFTRPLGLSGHGERILQLLAKDYILDEHGLDFDAPARCGFFDDFADGLCDLLAAFDNVLEDAGADYVAEGGLRALNEGLADVGDAESGFVGGGDAIVDDGGELERDIVLGHTDLLGDLCSIVSGYYSRVSFKVRYIPTI
jgi:hypothetical protein